MMAVTFEHLDPHDRAVAATAAREVVRRGGAALFTTALHACAAQVAFARDEGIAFDAAMIADTALDALAQGNPAMASGRAGCRSHHAPGS